MVVCAKAGIHFRPRHLEPDGVFVTHYQRIAVLGLG